MNYTGNIRKLKSQLVNNQVEYSLPLYDILEPKNLVPLNEYIGKTISIQFENAIHCVVSGKKIKKTFGNGMSYEAFMNSPQASPSIIKPELSRIHEGIALRDEAWEIEHHLKPHVVYLSKTSSIKVGVTRDTQIPTRWIDQGAVEAIRLAEVPYRQLAGLIEVELKNHVSDKTAWQRMLKGEVSSENLLQKKQELIQLLPQQYTPYISDNNTIQTINYPILHYPDKVKSIKLDKVPFFEKKLIGIKGQYLLFDDNSVINIRSHEGYLIRIEV